ncbi:E3 SUMO-protein ligase ZBED1 [Eurosta solidaginis]|uniref:E3 SUMO-protein ligase ZBED1 n=1 Tax=Eurosta solidaginis TaxID=178769 RepID=UPI003530EB22
MSESLQKYGRVTAVKAEVEDLKFVKLHSPKMKSVYWQHFGFPTNEDDRIITKQNVVCTLCHKVLTNHGNTTNLRAHLQHRHKDIFQKICIENGIRVPPRRPVVKQQTGANRMTAKRDPLKQKVKIEARESIQDTSNTASFTAEEPSMLYETMVPMTYDDDDVIDNDHFVKVEVSGNTSGMSKTKRSANNNSSVEVIGLERKYYPSQNRSDMGEMVNQYRLQDALVNMVINDVRNVDTLYDQGMSTFIRTLCGNVTLPADKKIESLIRELHSDKLTTLANQIKMRSQVKPYSLGFEIWKNVENKHFMSIYYNYCTDAPNYNLLNKLYCTVEYNKFTSIDEIFEEFNLENCAAAIVSYDYDDYLKHFLKTKDIPIILSYDVTVDKCLKSVFDLPDVASIFDQVKEMIMRYGTEISSKDVEIPTLNEEFPWTFYELLKFFSETVSWPEDVDILVASSKAIVDTLNILAMTLDTLKGEEIPHSSMLSPITSKIVNKKLSLCATDDEFAANLKNTISRELQDVVISDYHLTIAAMLDPRFHRLTPVKNPAKCVQILTNQYNKMHQKNDTDVPATKNEVENKPVTSSSRKSNLELFFDLQDDPAPTTIPQEDCNVENDLKRYRTEVYANLDESPFLWWNKLGHMYACLKRLAPIYQCIPCVVNMNFKKPVKQQIYEQHKRYMLTGSLIDAILFLHNNNENKLD